MSDLDSKLQRPSETGGKPRASLAQLEVMAGHKTFVEQKGKVTSVIRRPWLKDGENGEAEVWEAVGSGFFERV